MEDRKFCSAPTLVTPSDGEVSSLLSRGYLKRQFNTLVGLEEEERQDGGQTEEALVMGWRRE